MKRIAAALFAACLGIGTMSAYEVNLLQDCYNHNEELTYDRGGFYAIWKCFDEKSTEELPITSAPVSYFTKVVYTQVNGEYRLSYYKNYTQTEEFPANTSPDNFPEDSPIMFLSYPSSESNICYAYPINVFESGTYTISGSYRVVDRSSTKYGYLEDLSQIVFVANPNPEVKISSMSIAQKNGTNYIKVINKNGDELASAFTPANDNYQTFSKTIELTPNDKYLTIFAPGGEYVFGNLALKGNVTFTGVEDALEDVNACDTEEFYDLSGRKVYPTSGELPGGLYIRKTGTKTEKILIK